jgi:hypothetical protein
MKPKHYILTEKEMDRALKNAWDAGRVAGALISEAEHQRKTDCDIVKNRHKATTLLYRLAYGCKFGQELIDIEAACIMHIMRMKGRKRTVKNTSFIIKIMNYMKDALADARLVLYKDEEK